MRKIETFVLVTLIILLIVPSFGESQSKTENLKIIWPEEYKWKVGSNQETDAVHFLEIIPGKENIEKWTMLGTMMSIKNTRISTTDQVIEMYRQTSLKESSKAKLTVIEKNDTVKNVWTIFKIETPSFPNDPKPESQLYYAIQGEATLYVNFIAVREKKLSEEFIAKWTKVFTASEFVYQ
jgi:hypothetical protein